MKLNDISRIWDDLKSLKITYATEEIYNKGDVKIELRLIRGSFVLTMLLSASDSFGKKINKIKCKGMDFVYSESGSGKEIDIILIDGTLLAPFNGFLRDLYAQLEGVSLANESVEILLNTLNTWLKLFKSVNSNVLSEEQQLGLYGELYFILKLINNGKLVDDVINKWTGPDKNDKDFIFDSCSVEVKATQVSAPSISISSENQLHNVLDTNLFLSLFIFAFIPGNRNTLNKIISEIRSSISNVAIDDLFLQKLDLVGYNIKDEEYYNDKSYVLRDEKHFIVDDDFPKIIYGAVDPGVHGVSYTIEISACAGCVKEYDEIDALI